MHQQNAPHVKRRLWNALRLEELEATWHAALEDALRIVLSANILQPFLPLPFTEYVLPRMRIVEVYVTRLHVFFPGRNVNVVDKLQGNGLDCNGILRIFPGSCELGHDNRLCVCRKSRYYLLQKWRVGYHHRDYRLEGHGPDDTRAIPDRVTRALPKIVRAMQEREM